MRFKDIPPSEEMPPLPDADKNLVMHVSLPIPGGHVLMGSDAPESMGFKVNFGNNVYINLQPDTREETQRLFRALSEGGKVEMELQICSGVITTEVAKISMGCNGCLIALKRTIHGMNPQGPEYPEDPKIAPRGGVPALQAGRFDIPF